MSAPHLIVVGASLGGVEALTRLVAQLPATLPAALVAVLHLSADGPSYMAEILARAGVWPAQAPPDGEPYQAGHIYVPFPDRHLVVQAESLRHLAGPRENRHRPAIDPLFRSAAVYGRERTIGVVLTGLLDDGAEGLQAVRRCGGVTVVQEPASALHPEMPQSALDAGPVDHVVPLENLGTLLCDLVGQPRTACASVPEELQIEVRLLERTARLDDEAHAQDREIASQVGNVVPLTCPDCGGSLWQTHDKEAHFRCHLGHAYGIRSMLAAQEQATEEAIWAGLRSLEERSKTLEMLSRTEKDKGRWQSSDRYRDRAAESRLHAGRLRELLLTL